MLGLLVLAGCAQSACNDPDVLAYVDQARRSRDLYAIGPAAGPVRETAMMAQQPWRHYNMREAICSAPMLNRIPGQPGIVRTQQKFWVAKLASGYEVGLINR